MSDPAVPFVDLAHLLPALARERVTVRPRDRGEAYTMALLQTRIDNRVIAGVASGGSGAASLDVADLMLVLDPPTVRALAVVIAEAVGLDVRGGATVALHPFEKAIAVCTTSRAVWFATGRGGYFGAHDDLRVVPALATATDLPSALVAVARSLAGVRDV